MQFASMDFERVQSDGDPQYAGGGKIPFIADYTLEHEWLGVFTFEKAIDTCHKKAPIHPSIFSFSCTRDGFIGHARGGRLNLISRYE